MKQKSSLEIYGFSNYNFNESSKLRTMDYHQHNSVEISYVVAGELLIEYFDVEGNYQSFFLRQNQIAITKPFIKHKTSVSVGLQSMGLELVSSVNVVDAIKNFLADDCSELGNFFDSFHDIIVLHDTINVQNTVKQFKNYLSLDKKYTSLLAELEIKKLFVQILSCAQDNNMAKKFNRHINRAILYIRRHFNKDIQSTQVAAHLGLSNVYFQKLFHQELGVKFTRYINEQRISYATTLLTTTNYTLEKIAYMVGYNNTQNFINNFKVIKGTTPKKFRELIFDSYHVDSTSQIGSLYQESVFKNDSSKNIKPAINLSTESVRRINALDRTIAKAPTD